MIANFLAPAFSAIEGAVADLTTSGLGITALVIFVVAYATVPFENVIHLRKSKPVLVAAGIIWILAALAYAGLGESEALHTAIEHNLIEYAELFLFLLAAMTYINSLQERNVFEALRAYLVSRGFSLRVVFWVTGGVAFVLSPIADNLTTALIMGAVVMAVGGKNRKFVVISCINVVVAANAGGAFSPFGDITTLMVWQAGKVQFTEFVPILIPSLINWLVPAAFMHFAIGTDSPEPISESVQLKYGAIPMTLLFLVTIALAVTFHSFLHLPPAAGMMFGLGILGLFSFHVRLHEGRGTSYDAILGAATAPRFTRIEAVTHDEGALNQLVTLHNQPAFAIDKDHKITHWNPAMEKLSGIPVGEVIGTNRHQSAFHEEPREILADLVVRDLSQDELDERYPGRVRRHPYMKGALDAVGFFPRLGHKWFSFSASPIRNDNGEVVGAVEVAQEIGDHQRTEAHFDMMRTVSRAEWDTLLFFYGVILCVGGLSQFGYLAAVSGAMYTDLGPTGANSLVGVLSALIDNIPVMFAVLTMNPEMSLQQWQLVTLTAGVGGSMLSVGSAAGVALMGTARGVYTFGAHLKWAPVIALGYGAAILCHIWMNGT